MPRRLFERRLNYQNKTSLRSQVVSLRHPGHFMRKGQDKTQRTITGHDVAGASQTASTQYNEILPVSEIVALRNLARTHRDKTTNKYGP